MEKMTRKMADKNTMELLVELKKAGYYKVDIRMDGAGEKEIYAYYENGNHPEIEGLPALWTILTVFNLDDGVGYGQFQRGKKLFDRHQFDGRLIFGIYDLTGDTPKRIGEIDERTNL